MNYKKCERVLEKIDNAFREYGKNRVFLTGNNLNDIFLRDLRDGAYSLFENLKFYAENEKEFNWFLYVKEDKKVIYYQKKNGKLELTTKDEFIKQKMNEAGKKFLNKGKDLNLNSTKNSNINDEVDKKIDESLEDEQFYRILKEIIDEEKHKEKNVFIYIENFDWTASFYTTDADAKLINAIKGLEKLKKHLVIISLKQLKTLEERYFEEYDDKEVIKIGKPNMKEIENLLFRISWIELGRELPNLDYETLASQFCKSGNTLRECSRIFKGKLKEFKLNLTLDNFIFKTKIDENVSWKDVILDTKTKEIIYKNIDRFIKEENSTKKGMILTGPPGTGKTYIAKAIANEQKVYFMCPKLSDLKGQYVGQSAPKIKELFEEARLNEPTLIFLDEVDTLFPLRDSEDGDSYTKDITNEFLQQLDGVNTGTQKIYVLAATNRIESIDLAVKSRLGMPLEIGLPNEEERELHFKINLKKNLPKDFWKNLPLQYKNNLIDRSEGMSGRDIKDFSSILKNSLDKTELKDSKQIYMIHFNKAFKERKKFLINELQNKTGLLCISPEKIGEKELFGIEKLKTKIQDTVNQIKIIEREKRKDFQLELQNGILLYGPPGNGKSEIVEEVAKSQGMIFIKVESRDIIGYSNRDTLTNLDNIFSQSLQLSKVCEEDEGVMLFFDELDSLAGEGISSIIRGTLLGKLADKRGIRSNSSKLIFLGATNYYDQIDEAVKRKGRFDIHLELDNPQKETALKIIQSMLKKQKILINEDNTFEIIDIFYEIIKDLEVNKNIKGLRKVFENLEFDETDKNKLEKKITKMKENFLISSSYMKNMVTELKRFILKEENELKKGEFLKLTHKKLLEFKEEIEI